MTLFSYEIFDAVAREGSFNKAAQQLHLTPSAISHAIAVMEAELGFTLFNRGKNGVTMTSYGASLYPSIRAVLNSDEALKQSIARLNGLEKGKVKLGAFNSVCAGMLPGILKGFMAQYPQIEVEVYQGTYDDVKEWLRTGQIDLAFLLHLPGGIYPYRAVQGAAALDHPRRLAGAAKRRDDPRPDGWPEFRGAVGRHRRRDAPVPQKVRPEHRAPLPCH